MNDKKDFDNVRNALKVLGLTVNEVETVWKLIASILHLVSYMYTEHSINKIKRIFKY